MLQFKDSNYIYALSWLLMKYFMLVLYLKSEWDDGAETKIEWRKWKKNNVETVKRFDLNVLKLELNEWFNEKLLAILINWNYLKPDELDFLLEWLRRNLSSSVQSPLNKHN